MDLVLGASVMGDFGRLALLDAWTGAVIDRYDFDLSAEKAEIVVETIVNTDRGLTEDGHRMVGTRVSASDLVLGNDVRDELVEAGLANVTLESPSVAATAYVRTTAANAGERTSALLFVDGYTATLTVVGPDDARTSLIAAEPVSRDGPAAALRTLLERLAEAPNGAQSVYLVGASDELAAVTQKLATGIPFRATDQTPYAVALGAAMSASQMAAAASAGATAYAPPAEPTPPSAEPIPVSAPNQPDADDLRFSIADHLGPTTNGNAGATVEEPAESLSADALSALEPPTAVEEVAADEPDELGSVDPTSAEAVTVAEAIAKPPAPEPKSSEPAAGVPKPKKRKKSKLADAAPKPKKAVAVAESAVAAPEVPADAARKRPRLLLTGSTVAAAFIFVCIALATAAAIGYKPTANVQAYRDYESVPGKYLPVMPGQGTAPSQDDDTYLPRVVSINGPVSGGSTYLPYRDSPTVASGGGERTEVSTVDLPPLPPSLPGGFGTRLQDWLPKGMTGSFGELFPAAATCEPGDTACFLKTTGCNPGDVNCLNQMVIACKPGTPACRGTQVNQPHCGSPTGQGCAPEPVGPPCAAGDPSCVPPAPLSTQCPPGEACEPQPPVNPTAPQRVSPGPAVPPTEANTPPGVAPPAGRGDPGPTVEGPPSNTPPEQAPSPEPAAPTESAVTPVVVAPRLGTAPGPA